MATITSNRIADARKRIMALPEDTCFIMRQAQSYETWDPEDVLDLVPYDIYSHDSYENVCKYWERLLNKIQRAADRESVEIFCRTNGESFESITIFKGLEVIVYAICGKEKALELAL